MAASTREISGRRGRVRFVIGLLIFSIMLMALLDRPAVSEVEPLVPDETVETVDTGRL